MEFNSGFKGLNNVGKDKLAKVIALQINKIIKPSLNDKFVTVCNLLGISPASDY